MIKCAVYLIILTAIIIGLIAGFNLYLIKGCTTTIDTVIKVDSYDYPNGTRWTVVGVNDSYILASDPVLKEEEPKDLAAKIMQGKTYKFKTCGWRIPLINYYKVIVEAPEIK